MLRPIRQAKSKKTLKIDEYQVKVHKHQQEQQQPLIARSIIFSTLQPSEENTEKLNPNNLKPNLLKHQDECHCSRYERHQSAEKKSVGFRIKKSFTTHKFFKSFGGLDNEDKNCEDCFDLTLSVEQKQKIIFDIITVMKKNGILNESNDQKLEIRVQDLNKTMIYLISLNKWKSQQKSQEDQPKDQDCFIRQLDDLMRSQSMKRFRIYLNCPEECQQKIQQQIQRNKKIQQERRKKSAALEDLQKKINLKFDQILQLEQKINHLRTVFQKYQSKAFDIDHYLNEQNQVYIKQLCQEYQKSINDINSYSVMIQAWESRNKGKNSTFQDIQQNVKEQLQVIKELLVDGKSIQNQATFVKDFLLRVMQQLRAKYKELQKTIGQKTLWITELIKKIKKLVQFGSFKHEYLQNLVSQFTFTFLQAEEKLKALMINIQKQTKATDNFVTVQQIFNFVQSMNQNYLLTAAFN